MIKLRNDNQFINRTRITSFTATYPVTNTVYFGNYGHQGVLHNLKLKVKQNIKEEFSHKTYVRGGKTAWDCFLHDIDFSKFITDTFDLIKPAYCPNFKYDTDLNIVEAWGNVLKKGEFVAPHVHGSKQGILYLTKGNPLILSESNIEINPEPGDFILAPANVYHYVEEVQTEEERINIVFNYSLYDEFRSVNEQFKDQGTPPKAKT